jgi:hypothetical protein
MSGSDALTTRGHASEPPEGFFAGSSEPGRRPEEDVAHRSTLRLTFSYRERRVQLILMEEIEMLVPPSMDITSRPPGAEFWYELQDGRRAPLYRRTQRNPLDPSVEVLTDNPERPFAVVDSGRTEGEFTLLVPRLPEARSVVLYEWSLPEDAIQRDLPPAPSEIARFAVGEAIDKEAIAQDQIPPTTVSDALAAYEGTAIIHLRASDNTGQVASTVHRLDDGEPREGLTVTIDEPGEHTLVFWSVDLAGNVEPENRVTFTVRPTAERENT